MRPAHTPDDTEDDVPGTGPRTRRGVLAAVLVVVGLVLCLAYAFTASDEQHSYAGGEVAPYDVTLTAGHVYHLAVHGGVPAAQRAGVPPAALRCTYAPRGGAERTLGVTPEQSGTKAVNVIATFVAPVSGSAHVACTGLRQVFVDDADDASFDVSSLLLLLGVIALTVGVPLGLSVLRRITSVPPRADEPVPAPADRG